MPDRGWIILGLVLALGLLTFPIWYNSAAGTDSAAPELARPVQGDACIYPVDYMRANHMDVLIEWRDQVVRENRRTVTINGKSWEMSLSGTCMECHNSKEEFCDRCHNYAGVSAYCFDCHVAPEQAQLAEVVR